jgi:signal transduction histidine kinase
MHFSKTILSRTLLVSFVLINFLSHINTVSAQDVSFNDYILKAQATHGKAAARLALQAFQFQAEKAKPLDNAAITCAQIAIDNQSDEDAQAIIDLWQQKENLKKESIDFARLTGLQADIKEIQHQSDAAIELYQQALVLLTVNGGEAYEGDIYLGMALSYNRLRNYPKSLDCLDKAMNRAVKQMDEPLRLKTIHQKAQIYAQLANYSQAIELQLRANELANKLNNKSIEANSLNNLGKLYTIIGQHIKAQEALNQSLELFKQQNDSAGISFCLRNIGETYYMQGNASQASNYYQQSLSIQENLKDTLMMASLKVDLGKVAFKSNQHQEAIKHYMQAIDLQNNKNDKSLQSLIYYHLGETYLAMGNSVLSEEYCNKSLQIAIAIGERKQQAQCYNALSHIFEQKGDYKNALRSKNEYAQLKDTILNIQTIEHMARMDAIYRSLQKENTIKDLKAQNANASRSLDRQKITGITLLITTVLLLSISILMYFAYRYKQRASRKLRQINKELEVLNSTKDKFFSIISHDLKSPINSILGFSEMLVLHAETHSTETLIEHSQIIHNSTKKLYNLVDNLLLWSRTQVGSTQYKPEHLDIAILCQNIISLLRISASEKDILISSKIDKNLTAFADVNLFNTVMRNLISNAVKFSPVGATITVSAYPRNDEAVIAIADTGVGIDRENLDKLFRIDENVSTTGTFNEKGSGLGLILCKEFTEINKGTIWAESEPGKGSTFYFTVPLA